ncbi:MAG: hypothetical protein JWM68_2765 [Verrucomicrobiales bacterium]|nr:hypothetical protein [Verrucomicrobiales bacterium]
MDYNQDGAQPTPEDFAQTEQRLECEKLAAQIRQIEKPFYHKVGFYAFACPVVLALFGLIFLWSSGWFDTKRKALQVEQSKLTIQNQKLRQRADELADETRLLEEQNVAALRRIEETKKTLQKFELSLKKSRETSVSLLSVMRSEGNAMHAVLSYLRGVKMPTITDRVMMQTLTQSIEVLGTTYTNANNQIQVIYPEIH